MRNWHIVLFALFTLGCVAWLVLNWVSFNLLSFPCEDPTGQLSCEQVVDRAFAWRAGGTFLVWALAAWLTFRKQGEK